ncbi:hypothetical protein DOTSEDRAFT_35697 [Dothistroma septosporum NZE10]|uniref:Uncharacterized protein n=1 Tax=Dothistroma septosporum (strain NZE10 / CBS 128990) TaxID=675120 RepID=M2WN45_DOTSN|nr:hypothetical protein DOTSEDRAFT_35697 [Dothistroma septosporum NZE10]
MSLLPHGDFALQAVLGSGFGCHLAILPKPSLPCNATERVHSRLIIQLFILLYQACWPNGKALDYDSFGIKRLQANARNAGYTPNKRIPQNCQDYASYLRCKVLQFDISETIHTINHLFFFDILQNVKTKLDPAILVRNTGDGQDRLKLIAARDLQIIQETERVLYSSLIQGPIADLR